MIHSELLGMKADGNPSLNSFLFFTRSSPAVFNSCMLFSLSPSLFSLSLLPPLKSLGVLWFSKGQKRAALLSYRKAGRGTTVCYHLSLLLCVNTTGVTVLTPRPLTPCRLYIVPSCSHVQRNAAVQTHILRVVLMPTYTHTETCALLL